MNPWLLEQALMGRARRLFADEFGNLAPDEVEEKLYETKQAFADCRVPAIRRKLGHKIKRLQQMHWLNVQAANYLVATDEFIRFATFAIAIPANQPTLAGTEYGKWLLKSGQPIVTQTFSLYVGAYMSSVESIRFAFAAFHDQQGITAINEKLEGAVLEEIYLYSE